jgi:hypothetical protein
MVVEPLSMITGTVKRMNTVARPLPRLSARANLLSKASARLQGIRELDIGVGVVPFIGRFVSARTTGYRRGPMLRRLSLIAR